MLFRKQWYALRVLQCVAVFCSVLQCCAVWCSHGSLFMFVGLFWDVSLESVVCHELQESLIVKKWYALRASLTTERYAREMAHAYCVAVCCSVLQCVAVCCSVLQCRVSQCVAVCCSVLQCRVLQGVAVCCSVLHCVALCCSVRHVACTSYVTRIYESCHANQWVM